MFKSKKAKAKSNKCDQERWAEIAHEEGSLVPRPRPYGAWERGYEEGVCAQNVETTGSCMSHPATCIGLLVVVPTVNILQFMSVNLLSSLILLNNRCSSRYGCLQLISRSLHPPTPPPPLQPTPMNLFRAEGLSPYLEYELSVSAMNEFTMLDFPLINDPLFGRVTDITTLEGGMLVCVCVCVCVCVGGGGGGGGGGVFLPVHFHFFP